jgi:hypothetical protein
LTEGTGVGDHWRRRRRGLLGGGLALLVLSLASCKGGGKYPVRGQLQWEDGRPLTELAGFEVTFSSQELGKSARGTIQDDGTFELGTERDKDGALPGEYIVTLTQPHPEPERPEKRRPIIDLDYENPDLTPLRATVKPESNHFTFQLKPIKRGAR